ncbi:unnamed protein product [Symbiodinium natans]|uniref:Uncharacterized protein n=1 Tax=Symbiodinium natans TaxID=878477 RepID=A0A812PA86_9DINO|nr:unnamed protein product [Symbiodinium natans]
MAKMRPLVALAIVLSVFAALPAFFGQWRPQPRVRRLHTLRVSDSDESLMELLESEDLEDLEDALEEELERSIADIKAFEIPDETREKYETEISVGDAEAVGTLRHFATPVYRASLTDPASSGELNLEIFEAAAQLRESDLAGRAWCEENYPGGYTSFSSQKNLNDAIPCFQALEAKLRPHLEAFLEETRLMGGRDTSQLRMTDLLRVGDLALLGSTGLAPLGAAAQGALYDRSVG